MTFNEMPAIRILIVEQNDRLLSGLITTLTVYGDLELVGTAISANEAIDCCRRSTPDVVLMGITPPAQEWLAAIAHLREEQPEIGVIVLSTFAEDAVVKQAKQIGAVDHIRVGDSADTLIATIRNQYRS